MNKKTYHHLVCCFIPVFFILIGLLSGCSSSKGKETTEKPVAVEIKRIKAMDLPVEVETTGRLSANKDVTLMAEVSGSVKTYLADMGDTVERNQALVKINPVDYQLALNEAKANLTSAQAQLDLATKSYERSKALLLRDVISKDTFDKSESQYKASLAGLNRIKAMVDIARERLNKTTIRAPFSGRVANRMVEVGQTVGPGQPVMSIVDLDPMRVRIGLSEKDYIHLDLDDPVSVSIDAFPENSITARIDMIGVKSDPRTNTFDVDILVDNPDHRLKAGLTARVRITADIIPNTILIPQSTILFRERNKEVYIVDANNKAQRRLLRLGVNVGADVQVLAGLSENDRLVITGGQYLNPDVNVIISSPETANPQ